MAERIDNHLIYEILKYVQARLGNLEDLRGEMREGFASLRGAHLATQHADAAFLERRVVELERDVGRIRRGLELADQPEN